MRLAPKGVEDLGVGQLSKIKPPYPCDTNAKEKRGPETE